MWVVSCILTWHGVGALSLLLGRRRFSVPLSSPLSLSGKERAPWTWLGSVSVSKAAGLPPASTRNRCTSAWLSLVIMTNLNLVQQIYRPYCKPPNGEILLATYIARCRRRLFPSLPMYLISPAQCCPAQKEEEGGGVTPTARAVAEKRGHRRGGNFVS